MPDKFDGAVRRLRDARAGASPGDAAAPGIRSIEDQLAAIAAGDYTTAVQNAADDVRFEIFAPPEFAFVRRARGPKQLLDAIRTNFAAVRNQQPEISNVVAQGDTVVLIGRERGNHTATGAAYEVEFVHRFTFRDGRLESLRIIAARSV